jgi:general secretion pathway protein M
LTLFSTPLTSRLVALLLLAAAILAAYTLVVEPIVVGYSARNQHIGEMRDQLARFERAAAMRPALLTQMKELEAQKESQGYFLTGDTDPLAAAGLQDQVRTLVMDKGGTLQSMQAMPGVEEKGLTRITLRVQMSGTTETLFEVLYVLESGNPILFVDNVDIQNRDGSGTSGDQAAGLLTVAFDLSGYLPKE